ncbi:MAG TPA: acyltransferase [Rhizomicrobium sp.]|jgi:peptidoglycan/LPS O-acetylase OafA/YrhL|nr:acyltransferase [Rhizomicrobium sp.]
MRRETSIYLNMMRFTAALVVFLGHLAGRRFTAGLLWPVSHFMDMAVIIFFVLSGYVIAYVTDTHERTLEAYAANRIARVLSVALPALAITCVLDMAGRTLHPDYYSAVWGFSADRPWLQYLSGLTFTNELWWNHINVGSMLPYWSLAYEVWYYAIFAAFWYLRGPARYLIAIAFALIAGPKILTLFPIWIGGFAVYHLCRKPVMPRSWAIALFSITLLVPLLLLVQTARSGLQIPSSTLDRYLTAIVFALNIVAIQNAPGFSGALLKRVEKPVQWLAGMTFSLYLFHLPVAQFLTTVTPWPPASWSARVVSVAGTFLLVVLLAELTERRKDIWRRLVTWVFVRLSASRTMLHSSTG